MKMYISLRSGFSSYSGRATSKHNLWSGNVNTSSSSAYATRETEAGEFDGQPATFVATSSGSHASSHTEKGVFVKKSETTRSGHDQYEEGVYV